EKVAVKLGLVATAEAEVGTAAVAAEGEAVGAFAGIGAAASAALAPVAALIAALSAAYIAGRELGRLGNWVQSHDPPSKTINNGGPPSSVQHMFNQQSASARAQAQARARVRKAQLDLPILHGPPKHRHTQAHDPHHAAAAIHAAALNAPSG